MAKKTSLDFLDDIIAKSKIYSKGIILNGIKKNRFKYYYGKYGYGYGYGYGYCYGYGYGYDNNNS